MKGVLTIAGSDPSGGAGIQADLRVIWDHGMSGGAVITALTIQNTQRVDRVSAVDPAVIREQLEVLLIDARYAAVKIGMIPGAGAAAAIAEVLGQYECPNVVIDPVLASSGGAPFLDDAGKDVVLNRLLPLCSLVTPNLDEAAALTGLPVATQVERERAAQWLQRRGAVAVLIKGGHLSGAPDDLLLDPNGSAHLIPGDRVHTEHTHGTGCFLSTAIACRLALGDSLTESVARAKRLLEDGLRSPSITGCGRGSPFPASRRRPDDDRTHAWRISHLPGLYVVTDPGLQHPRNSEDVASLAYEGGASVMQLRDKSASAAELIKIAGRIARRSREAGALFIVNDRVDVAIASDADGVHLGPGDMDPFDARRILGWDRLIGVSVGSIEEARRFAPVASYFGVGAVFGSTTKLDAGAPVGTVRVREIRAEFPDIPVVAIGGINQNNIRSVVCAGAHSAAVVSAVVGHPDVTERVSHLVGLMKSGYNDPGVPERSQ